MDDPGKIQKQRPSLLRTILVGRNPRRTLVRIVVLIVVVFGARRFVLIPVRVEGPSMLPAYSERGINFANRLAYLSHEPQRGDVVTIRTTGTSIMYMKRIVGLPGETVSFHDGKLFIDGEPRDEPYEKLKCYWNDDGDHTPKTLGAGEYFFVGDNRSMPMRFHTFGAARRDRIVGKILLCKNLFGS
jgi:signal peptidase I